MRGPSFSRHPGREFSPSASKDKKTSDPGPIPKPHKPINGSRPGVQLVRRFAETKFLLVDESHDTLEISRNQEIVRRFACLLAQPLNGRIADKLHFHLLNLH